MAFEQEFDSHIEWLVNGRYEEDGDECFAQTNIVVVKDTDEISFTQIKKETEKAWLLIIDGCVEMWFPKSCCKIHGNTINVPKWLKQKKITNNK